MNRVAFLRTLRDGLGGLPAREIDDILADYAAYFDEAHTSGRSEDGYQGQSHWLMFLFEVKLRLAQAPPAHREGKFQFFPRESLAQLRIPQTDLEQIWPWFWRHRKVAPKTENPLRNQNPPHSPPGNRGWLPDARGSSWRPCGEPQLRLSGFREPVRCRNRNSGRGRLSRRHAAHDSRFRSPCWRSGRPGARRSDGPRPTPSRRRNSNLEWWKR